MSSREGKASIVLTRLCPPFVLDVEQLIALRHMEGNGLRATLVNESGSRRSGIKPDEHRADQHPEVLVQVGLWNVIGCELRLP